MYTCTCKPIGGDCGTKHRSIKAAAACLRKQINATLRDYPGSICSWHIERTDGEEMGAEEQRKADLAIADTLT